MPVGWLTGMSKAARTFYPIAMKGVSQGLAANSILKAYSAAGPGIRRTVGLEVIRRVKGVELKAGVFRYLKKNVLPSLAKIPFTGADILKSFSYLTEFRAVTAEGKSVTGNISIVSWTRITPEAAEADALAYLEGMPAKYGIEAVEKIQLVNIVKSAHWPTQ